MEHQDTDNGRAGSDVTFDEFVAARLSVLLRYATALTFDPHLAEDLVQEVLLRAERRWRRIARLAAPEAYVKRMIINEYFSWRRKKSSRDVPLSHDVLDAIAPARPDPTLAHDQHAELAAMIATLPRKQRAVLMLRYFDDLPDDEIAEILGCGPITVRTHASRALATLRTRGTPVSTIQEGR